MKKSVFNLLIILTLILNGIVHPLNQCTIAEAKIPYMKKLNVKWNLQENMWTIVRTNFAGNVWVKSRAMIKNISIKDSSKENLKTLKCTIFFERPMPTKNQIKKIMHSNYYKKYNDIGGFSYHWWIFDYFSGNEGLRENNIKMKQKFKHGKIYKYKDYDGCWIKTTNFLCNLTVKYPKDYKNLCIGISGNGSYKYISHNGIDEDGELQNHPAYQKDKKYIHFMRIK